METLREWEQKIEEREQKIRMAFFGYARDNELPVFNTSYYFAKQILPDESFFLKMKVMEDLKE